MKKDKELLIAIIQHSVILLDKESLDLDRITSLYDMWIKKNGNVDSSDTVKFAQSLIEIIKTELKYNNDNEKCKIKWLTK
ncbi:hypothetical protein [Enterococcus durans]|uniref:hypothetical protein n=1 Tax=Enterococcus durans TaxID=53345 RepID=UPI00189CF683|nr:hypothetical protein [Enterococcus durans]EHV9021646.1 hypothetical protein [Listeria monocytogenes]EHV9021904.1 hypothetical protein [Listeria monocytogenes]MDB1684412.1 hypothetical protein [Enterococcus durans]